LFELVRSKAEFCQMLGTRLNSPINLWCLDSKRGGRPGPCTTRVGSGYGILRPSRTRPVGSGRQCLPCRQSLRSRKVRKPRGRKDVGCPAIVNAPFRSYRGWRLPGWRLRTTSRQQTGKFPAVMRRVYARHAAQPNTATFRATVAGRWGIVCAAIRRKTSPR